MGSAREILEKAGIEIVWFDSLGAKCFSIAVRASPGYIVIDPGAAEMQPSYPLPKEKKFELRRRAIETISQFMEKAYAAIVTHYHYDHHVLPTDKDLRDARRYWLSSKLLLLKNPNMYINESQWKRARLFLHELLSLVGTRLADVEEEPQITDFEDPVEKLSIALSKDFGSYTDRRRELLSKGRQWFNKLKTMWSSSKWVREVELPNGTRILWCDNREIEIGDVKLRFLEPWFHGIEYDRTGWVVPIEISCRGWRIFYSSDVMGPMIEDYAEYIARLRPDIVFLDGPPTYLFPYMLNRTNLQRAIENAITVISSKPKLVVYDHHLLREKKWRERVKQVFIEASKCGVEVMTAAECLGKTPLIDTI